MLRAKQLAVFASLLLIAATTAAAQQDVGGFDEPCTAAFVPMGYWQLNRFVPSEASPLAQAKVRGVVARSLLWKPGETLKVCFRSGTQKARARVAQFASEWLQYANVKFDFGDIADPQMCRGDNHEAIKIDFLNTGPKAGNWSAVGRYSLQVDHSMNLSLFGEDELPRDRATGQPLVALARKTILHEFGHALGLHHEHQSPKSGCDAEFDPEAVIVYGSLFGWSPQLSAHNLMQILDRPELNATEIDRRSIMHYALPPRLFKAREKSPCFVRPNFELSDGDKAFIAKVYPKKSAPQVAAKETTVPTVRGARPPAASEHLFEDYRQSLQEAGVEKGRIEQLTNEFKAILTK